MTGKIRIIVKETLSGKFTSLIVIAAVAVSVSVFGIFETASSKFANYIETRFASSIPPNTIKLSPPPARNFFMFDIKRDPSELITDRTIRSISQMDGVKKIDPVLPLKVPAQAAISFFGFSYRSDLNVLGVNESLISDDIIKASDRRRWNRPGISGSIPVVVPRMILNAYNEGMAASNNLPRITEKTAREFRLRLIVGKSSIRTLEDYTETTISIAGFTDRINVLALLLPVETVKSYNRQFNPGSKNEYSSLFIEVKDHESLISISEVLKDGKFRVETDKTLSDSIINLKNIVESVISLFKILIIALSAVLVYFSGVISVFNRIEYYRLLRALGSSKLFIAFTLSFKYALLGAAGTFIGIEALSYIFQQSAHLINIEGLSATVEVTEDFRNKVILYGISLPLLSVLPALLRLYTKDLSRD